MKWGPVVLLLLAAAASAFNIVSLRLEHLMDPRWGDRDVQLFIAGLVIVVLTIGALLIARKSAMPGAILLGATALVVAAGFFPRVILAYDQQQQRNMQAVVDRAKEAKLLSDIEARGRDIEERIAARRAFTGPEAEALIELVRSANLSYASLPDHTARAMPLLQRALDGKVLDPNVLVRNRFIANAPPVPLVLQFHRLIRQTPTNPVLAREWNILLLLARSGVDLAAPGSEALAADLRKTATPAHGGLYVELK